MPTPCSEEIRGLVWMLRKKNSINGNGLDPMADSRGQDAPGGDSTGFHAI